MFNYLKRKKMTLRNFDKIFDSYLDWDMNGYSSDTTARVEDDVLLMDFEVPGLGNKDVQVNVEDRHLHIKAEKEHRKFERKYRVHDSYDLNQTSAVCKDGILTISIPKYEDRKAKSITVKVK
tara:strand:- start:18 stop:383 length:366 start_codon:yes stop_codon:yes gene_type:complete